MSEKVTVENFFHTILCTCGHGAKSSWGQLGLKYKIAVGILKYQPTSKTSCDVSHSRIRSSSIRSPS